MSLETPGFKPRSFWERPEGTTGMIMGVLLAALGLWGLNKALPFIIGLLENTLYATVLGVAAVVLLMVVTDKRFWTLVSYGYRSAMRWLTNLYTTIDPIGILKNYVEDLKASLSQMEKQIGNLRGQMRKLKEVIDLNAKRMGDALKLAGEAQKKQERLVLSLKAKEVGRYKESNLTLQALYTKMEVLYRVLIKMYETSQALLADIESEVDVKSRERDAIRASYSAFKSAMRIIKGDSDKRALFDETMEYLAHDYGMKLGEIENFVEMSAGFIQSIDLQNGVYEADALKMLEEWEKKGDSILLGDSKAALIAKSYDAGNVLDLDALPSSDSAKTEPRKGVDYDTLFNS